MLPTNRQVMPTWPGGQQVRPAVSPMPMPNAQPMGQGLARPPRQMPMPQQAAAPFNPQRAGAPTAPFASPQPMSAWPGGQRGR